MNDLPNLWLFNNYIIFDKIFQEEKRFFPRFAANLVFFHPAHIFPERRIALFQIDRL